jgi:hypothetical protein
MDPDFKRTAKKRLLVGARLLQAFSQLTAGICSYHHTRAGSPWSVKAV